MVHLATLQNSRDAMRQFVMQQDQSVIKDQIRVLSVDEVPLMREGIATIINAKPDMQVVAHASSAHEAIQHFREHRPDVTLMDLRLPDMSGIDAMIAIRKEFPKARFVVFTSFEGDCEIRRAFAAGARSYMLKSTPASDLAEAIRRVHAGKKSVPPDVAARIAEHLSEDPLSEREVEVLKLAMTGNRNRDIADRLFISEETVKAHMKHILVKLGASDRTQAVTIAARRGIIHI
jgi:DNA-binding NarL/FixJ family response regulator